MDEKQETEYPKAKEKTMEANEHARMELLSSLYAAGQTNLEDRKELLSLYEKCPSVIRDKEQRISMLRIETSAV